KDNNAECANKCFGIARHLYTVIKLYPRRTKGGGATAVGSSKLSVVPSVRSSISLTAYVGFVGNAPVSSGAKSKSSSTMHIVPAVAGTENDPVLFKRSSVTETGGLPFVQAALLGYAVRF